jgi:hypothetical protein
MRNFITSSDVLIKPGCYTHLTCDALQIIFLSKLGSEHIVPKSLVAFDTDHIKHYVFATDRLKEIRGASSLLDKLNRIDMAAAAEGLQIQVDKIYTNGGAGLFIVESTDADAFGQEVQKRFHTKTNGGASVTYVKQDLPPDAPDNFEEIKKFPLKPTLDLLRLKLREAKGHPPDSLPLPSHPFMSPCNSCGIAYAQQRWVDQSQPGEIAYYCASCRTKQSEDNHVKGSIEKALKSSLSNQTMKENYSLWNRILTKLARIGYEGLSDKDEPLPDRPEDFDTFRDFAASKEYLGLIYADGNNMGKQTEKLKTLAEYAEFANGIDDAIYEALAFAINEHLPIVTSKDGKGRLFPFDILMLGGDDIVILTDASKAMEVALTAAQHFYKLTHMNNTLSAAVVLAPVKYPFGMVQNLAQSALKAAKKESARVRNEAEETEGLQTKIDDTRINFMVITGGSLKEYDDVLKEDYIREDDRNEFQATLRPYAPEDLAQLLSMIRDGQRLHLGRTKLHQLREAILKRNVTTSVLEGLATLRNWKENQRRFVLNQVYAFNKRYTIAPSDPKDPHNGFPRVTFPWFITTKEHNRKERIYRTSLLDFVELYDFVSREADEQA